jgi:hypothetical protein
MIILEHVDTAIQSTAFTLRVVATSLSVGVASKTATKTAHTVAVTGSDRLQQKTNTITEQQF